MLEIVRPRRQLGVPVVPVAHNAGWIWPKGVFGKRPGTVTISFGPPLSAADFEGLGRKETVEAMTSEVMRRIGTEVERAREARA